MIDYPPVAEGCGGAGGVDLPPYHVVGVPGGGRLKVQVSNANVALSLEVQNVKVDLKGWYLSMAPWQQAVREGTGLVRWPVMASGIPEHQ